MRSSCLTDDAGNVIIQFDPAFDYEPLVLEKRITEKYSNKFLFITTEEPCFGPNSGTIKYDNHLDSPCMYRALLAAYRDKDTKFIFKGHHGDEYEVILKRPTGKQKGGRWEVKGEFLVTCIIKEFDLVDPDCPCPGEDVDLADPFGPPIL